MTDYSATVFIRVHTQPGGEPVAWCRLPDGRVIRVCGYQPQLEAAKEQPIEAREVAIDVLQQWVRWLRRGSRW